ncbi:MAG: hypothetical protein WB588_05405 [Dehalococcoidia bacterium]
MGIAHLILNFVSVLAWPLTVLTIVLIFRKPLAQAIAAIEELRYKDLGIKFRRDLRFAEDKAKALKLPPTPSARQPIEISVSPSQNLIDLAYDYPRAAVAEAWRSVENALGKLALKYEIPSKGMQAEHDVLHKLTLSGELPYGTGDLYDRLRKLRNQAVHEAQFNISWEQAASYVDLALSLASFLESISNDQKS